MVSRLIERISRVLLLMLLVFAVLWRGGKGIEATWLLVAVAGFAVMAAFFVHRKAKEEREVPDVLWISAVLFLLWTALSFLFSLTRNYGLDEVLRDGALVLLLLWTARWMRDAEGEFHPFVRQLLLAFVILTVIACAVGTAVYVLQPVNRFVGSFFYYRFSTDYWPNAWAEYMLLAWPVILIWARNGGGGKTLYLRGALLGLVLGCFFLSYSRGAAIAFIGQWALFAIFLSRGIDLKKNVVPFLRILAIGGIVSVTMFITVNGMRSAFYPVVSVTRKITFTADEGSSSFTERKEFLKQASTLAYMRPLWGWGPYSFRFAQPRLQEEVLQTSDHPHNVILKYAAERGVPVAAFYVLLLGAILVPSGLRLLRKAKVTVEQRTTSLLFVAVAGVLAHNLIDYNLQFVGIALPLALFLGLLAPGMKRKSATAMDIFKKRVEIVLAMSILIVAAAEFPALVTSSLGRHAEASGDAGKAQEWYERTRYDIYPRDLYLGRAVLYLDHNAAVDAERMLQKYLKTNSEDARGWKLLGNVQLRQFRAQEASDSFRQAYLLARWNDIGIVRGYLQALTDAGAGAEIRSQSTEIQRLMGEFATAIRKNTHFIALTGNVEQFLELAGLVTRVYGDSEGRINDWVREAEEHTRQTRFEFSSRRPGFLW